MNKILVETSARHVHVTLETLKILTGKDELGVKKMLSQPGQFASDVRLDLVGPKKTISGVSILGPVRSRNQVEISLTDARTLGLSNVPVRLSGDTDNTPGITLVGPAGSVTLENGVIVAKRHIHMTPKDAEEYGVKDRDVVKVKVTSADRSLIYDDVVIRVSEKFALAMHIDTDEANAAHLSGEVYGELIK